MTIDEDHSQRQEKRDSLFLSATVRLDGVAPIVTRVRNLSAGGMMIDAENGLAIDHRLVAEIRGIGEVHGRIAWCAAGRAGVAFDAEVDPRLARAPVAVAAAPVPEFLKPPRTRRPGLAIR